MADSAAAGGDSAGASEKPSVMQHLRDATLPETITKVLKNPTKSVAKLPKDAVDAARRIEVRHNRELRPYIWAIVLTLITFYILIYTFVGGEENTNYWAALATVGLAAAFFVAISRLRHTARSHGDHTIIMNLLLAIAYIDRNLSEWPDTAHKLELARYVDGAAKGFPPYLKQLSIEMTLEKQALAERHTNGLASLKDEISVSDQSKIRAIRSKLVGQLKLFTSGKWDQMMVADKPPKDQTTAPRRHLLLQVLVVLLLIGGIASIAYYYRGEWAGGVAAVALVIALLALVFMFVPKFADAFGAATAAFKGAKDGAPSANDSSPDSEDEKA